MDKKKIKNYLLYLLHAKRVTAKIILSTPNKRLAGKKIIVTGGGRGLGLSMAKKFIDEGAKVLIAGRNEKVLLESSQQLGCAFLKLDVTDISTFDAFLNEARLKLGGIDGLVNNAGISLHEDTFFDVTPDSFDRQVNTNLKGGYFLTQHLIAKWKETEKEGNILFVSSETGDTCDFRPYGFTKVALNSMVKGLSRLFAKECIRINAVAPGVTCSEMTGIQEDNLYFPNNSLERAYLPEEIAEVACFLMSDISGCLSGQIITCNNANTVNVRWK